MKMSAFRINNLINWHKQKSWPRLKYESSCSRTSQYWPSLGNLFFRHNTWINACRKKKRSIYSWTQTVACGQWKTPWHAIQTWETVIVVLSTQLGPQVSRDTFRQEPYHSSSFLWSDYFTSWLHLDNHHYTALINGLNAVKECGEITSQAENAHADV